MIRTSNSITAAATRRWMNPPNVYEVISPITHSSTKMIAMAHNMVSPPFDQAVIFLKATSNSFHAFSTPVFKASHSSLRATFNSTSLFSTI